MVGGDGGGSEEEAFDALPIFFFKSLPQWRTPKLELYGRIRSENPEGGKSLLGASRDPLLPGRGRDDN